MTRTPVYMDSHATTRVDPRVVQAMLPCFDTEFGNAASRTHAFGWRAEEAVTRARTHMARLIGADPKEIVFTSGATESDNLAIFGAFEALRSKGDHIVTGATEHHAVLDPVARLQSRGARVTVLPVDRDGRVDPGDVRRAITGRTVLVSLMFANNEVGTLHPVAEIGAICKEAGVLFHSDAAQAVGKVPVDVQALGVDLLSMSAHKAYGPKGVGALFVRRKNPRVALEPILFGGGHERGLRSGTLNVPGIVGFGEALRIAAAEMPEESRRLRALRDRLHQEIAARLADVTLNGHPVERLPHNLNLSFAYVEGEALMSALDDIAVSSGSACTSASKEPSHVLRAMGRTDDQVVTSIRFGLGRFNTRDEVDYVVERVEGAVTRLRALSPLYEAAGGGARFSRR
ncbi:MAG: IscS subfamily cysteine desulfurase [Acidobacteria bacterium]|nr:MAG: IscS subfamily cysteine desulfurase [Acidobacteriota bacterium]